MARKKVLEGDGERKRKIKGKGETEEPQEEDYTDNAVETNDNEAKISHEK